MFWVHTFADVVAVPNELEHRSFDCDGLFFAQFYFILARFERILNLLCEEPFANSIDD